MAAFPAAAAPMCSVDGLSALALRDVSIESTKEISAREGALDYCTVVGRLRTSGFGAPPGSAGFELRLPSRWNGKFLFFGVGGLAGSTYSDFSANRIDEQAALGKGYATAITDMGHQAGRTDASWALGADRKVATGKVADYYYRATHQVTLAGKALVLRYYGGESVLKSYFDGCSNGGRQALVEATRFPDDYDGIIAGDPFLDIRYILGATRIAKQMLDRQSYIPAALLSVIDAAVTKSCGDADGVADGLIQNPALCSAIPTDLICKAGQTKDCLSSSQANTLAAYIGAVRDDKGNLVYPGYAISNLAGVSRGALSGAGADRWTMGIVEPSEFSSSEPWGNAGFKPAPNGFQFADHILKYIVVHDPAFDMRRFPISADGVIDRDALKIFDEATKAGHATSADDFDAFFRSGRKLILYHGFSDPALTPYRTILLYEAMAARAGGYDHLRRSARLFMVPGMQHCEGGPGPNYFDTLSALDAWVEDGVPPAELDAVHHIDDDLNAAVDRSMPLCPFPTQASYKGSGGVMNAQAWACTPNRKLLEIGESGRTAGLPDPTTSSP